MRLLLTMSGEAEEKEDVSWINCCSYLSLQTSLAEPNKYIIKQSGHEVNRDRQPDQSKKNGISEKILLDIQSPNNTQKKILSNRRPAKDYDYQEQKKMNIHLSQRLFA